tara:strand:+ start:12790 stop:18345 length:5556 start_codon:yes stop_codon:yes gene_type:complete
MAVTPKVLLKRSSVAGKVPTTSDLDYGELAVNFADGKIYYKNSSNQIKAFVDSARVEAIANAVEVIALAQLDSGEVTGLIDSAYIQARIPESYLATLIDSAYVNLRADHYTGFNTDFAAKSTSDLTEGSNLYYTKARADSDIAASLNDSGNTVSITINNTIEDKVDSAYVLARVAEAPFLNSADAVNLIDSAYIQARQNNFLDSALTTQLIDSAYVQARQSGTTIGLAGNTGTHTLDPSTETLTFLGTTGQINAGIAANNVTLELDQNINSITSIAFEGDSTNSNETKIQAVNPTKDNTVSLPDSSGTIALTSDITATIDSAYIQARQSSTGTVDSAGVLAIIDSAYIKTVGGIDADKLDGQHGNYYRDWNNVLNAPTILDLTDVSTQITADVDKAFVDALNVDAATLDGQNAAYYLNYNNFTSTPTIPTFGNDFVDSATVLNIINSEGLESDLVIALVDSAYIQLRDRFQDSSLVTSTVDSNYIQIRRPAAAAFAVVNSGSGAYAFNGDGFSGATNNPTLYLQRGLKYKFSVNASGHPFYIKTNNVIGSGSLYSTGVTNNGAAVGDIFFEVPMNAPDLLYYQCQYHAQMHGLIRIFDINTFIDSAGVSQVITADVDQAFVNALNIDADNLDGQTGTFYLDYNNFTNTPTPYSLTIQDEGSGLSTGATTLNFVGSAVTASGTGTTKTITISQAAGGTDSATVSAIINTTVDSAYVQARQTTATNIDSIGAIGNVNSIGATHNQILKFDSATQKFILATDATGGGGGGGLDSALVSQLVDSSYIQLRQLNETASPLTQTNTSFTATASQSSFTGLIIDSDKFQVYLNGLLLPKADYTHNTSKVDLKVAADSGDVLEVIKFGGNETTVGSTPFTQTFFTKTLDSGALTYSGNDDNGNSLSYTAGAIAVYLNGILLLDTVDYTATNGTSITLLDSASAEGGDKLTVLKFGGNTTGVDSADVLNLIDSAYINARIGSGTVEAIVDSAYIQLRDRFQDSSGILAIVDSAYVQARQTAAGTDSATVSSIITADVDSDFIFDIIKIKAKKKYYIQPTQPTISELGEYWYKTDSDILYKSVPNSALSTTMPGYALSSTVHYNKIYDWAGNNSSSATRTNISGTDALGGSFTSGTTASAWFAFTATLTPTALNASADYDFTTPQDLRGIIIENSDPNAGRLERIDYENGDYADNGFPGGGTVTWYNSGGVALGKTASANTTGNTFVDISHPSGVKATGIGFSQIGDYYSGNDVFLFFAGNPLWQEIDKARTDSAITAIIDSDHAKLLITNGDLDMKGNKVLFGNVYDSVGALPSATTYHGMFAHVHNTGAGYFAHAGNWVRLANQSELSSAGLDSALTTQLIDSAYVQLRQSGGGSSLTIQDEGSSLSTAATTLNFVGSGVTASGSGATKTITISGGGGGGGSGLDSALVSQLIDSDYIGTKVDFTRGEFTTQRSQYTATASQTAFTHSSIDPTHLDVYLNGVLQVVGTDYNASTTAVTFTTGVDSGHSVSIVERRGRVATQRGLTQQNYYYTTASPTTSITGADDNSITLDYSSGTLDVFLNGILLKDSDDYSTNAGTTVTLVSATDSGDLVTLVNRKGIIVSPTVKNYEYTATASQTTFSGADINGNTLAYTADAIQVYLNGILLRNTDYTAVNGTSIILASGATVNDELVISAFSNPGHNMELYKFTADSAQTLFSGNDLTGKSLAYSPGNIQVHLNGLLLNDSDDYVANNGMGVRLLTGALANDEIKITSFVSNSNTLRTNAWSAPTDSSVTAVAGDKLFIDTSVAKTITLPSSASLGDEIRIIDVTGNAATNNITVARNGHNIQGSGSDLTININRAGIGLVYYNTTQGWVLIEN